MRTTVFSTPIITPILRLISITILKIIGWKVISRPLENQRFVLIAAPHTSNWDFPLMLMVVLQMRMEVFWMGKETLFPFPFGGLMKWLGGIPINRDKAHNVVHQTTKQFSENESLIILIPPEGTRKKVERWKSGFYHIANNAKVPILLGYIDASKKEGGLGDFFIPTGDKDKDMQAIKDYYKTIKGINADNS